MYFLMKKQALPVWALPAAGAAIGGTAGLLGGINIDDPRITPSIRAKKLLRCLLLGGVTGLGLEGMRQGGKLIFKQSSYKPKGYLLRDLLLKQAEEETTTPPADPAATTGAGTGNSWFSGDTWGVPNHYLVGGGLGALGGLTLYHLLNDKRKRRPSGYLGSALAGLGVGALGAGVYRMANGYNLFGGNAPGPKIKPAKAPEIKNLAVSDVEGRSEEAQARRANIVAAERQKLIANLEAQGLTPVEIKQRVAAFDKNNEDGIFGGANASSTPLAIARENEANANLVRKAKESGGGATIDKVESKVSRPLNIRSRMMNDNGIINSNTSLKDLQAMNANVVIDGTTINTSDPNFARIYDNAQRTGADIVLQNSPTDVMRNITAAIANGESVDMNSIPAQYRAAVKRFLPEMQKRHAATAAAQRQAVITGNKQTGDYGARSWREGMWNWGLGPLSTIGSYIDTFSEHPVKQVTATRNAQNKADRLRTNELDLQNNLLAQLIASNKMPAPTATNTNPPISKSAPSFGPSFPTTGTTPTIVKTPAVGKPVNVADTTSARISKAIASTSSVDQKISLALQIPNKNIQANEINRIAQENNIAPEVMMRMIQDKMQPTMKGNPFNGTSGYIYPPEGAFNAR